MHLFSRKTLKKFRCARRAQAQHTPHTRPTHPHTHTHTLWPRNLKKVSSHENPANFQPHEKIVFGLRRGAVKGLGLGWIWIDWSRSPSARSSLFSFLVAASHRIAAAASRRRRRRRFGRPAAQPASAVTVQSGSALHHRKPATWTPTHGQWYRVNSLQALPAAMAALRQRRRRGPKRAVAGELILRALAFGVAAARASCPLLIDVRTASEWAAGHASCAYRVPVQDNPALHVPQVLALAGGSRAARVMVYCRSGGRAGSAVSALVQDGFTNVANIGGWEVRLAAVVSPLCLSVFAQSRLRPQTAVTRRAFGGRFRPPMLLSLRRIAHVRRRRRRLLHLRHPRPHRLHRRHRRRRLGYL
jgi:phage shock protein E